MELDHINICAPSELMETVREFYCDVLNFKVGPRPEIPIPGYWLYAQSSEQAAVHLLESDSHSRPQLNHLDHIAFRTSSLGSIREKLNRRGVEFGHLDFPDFKLEQISFLDPSGVKIEINAYKA
jgi:catechol 2,3-dioxygenase-like lactoylglutathione lyase family enzyme